MKILDAHMHLPVNFSTPAEKKDALLAEMRKNNVGRGIVISDSELTSDIGSMRECAELFEGCPNISAVGGISPYIDYERQLRLLEGCIIRKTVVGIKIFSGHEPIYLNDTILTPIYGLARKYGVPVLFHSGWDNPQYSSPEIIRQTAQAYPDVALVCCHCCYPALSECFGALAEYANVYFDVSSTADDKAVSSEIGTALEKAIPVMPDRFIFGSDYACCSQSEHIEFCSRLDISDNEKALLFSENAERIFGLN